jgi:hypothetical protein
LCCVLDIFFSSFVLKADKPLFNLAVCIIIA